MRIYQYTQDNIDSVLTRSQLDDRALIDSVNDIIDNVKMQGDKALFEYCKKFDNCAVNDDNIVVSQEELDNCKKLLSPQLKEALLAAIDNVKDYHKRQMERYNDTIYTKDSSKLGWLFRPMQRVGVYVPGGKAKYPSSVIMCAVPAIVAGVKDVVIATPNPNPITLAAAALCGIKTVYRMGGAHAVAALAYGTNSVDKVDLIAGPGNVYVTLAKKAVYGHVAIDMIAGPSEILVIADDSARAEYVAADLLSQAEHDEMAASILVTTSAVLAKKVQECVQTQLQQLERKVIIEKSLANNGAIIIVDSLDTAAELANKIAPEHLEICVKDNSIINKITNAGAIFVGNYSPEPLGDYFAGASHCLPTSGSARYFNVLSVDTFMRKMSYIEYSKDDLLNSADKIIAIGEAEGLTAHANTIKMRVKMEGDK